jgi:hypothetical protein
MLSLNHNLIQSLNSNKVQLIASLELGFLIKCNHLIRKGMKRTKEGVYMITLTLHLIKTVLRMVMVLMHLIKPSTLKLTLIYLHIQQLNNLPLEMIHTLLTYINIIIGVHSLLKIMTRVIKMNKEVI